MQSRILTALTILTLFTSSSIYAQDNTSVTVLNISSQPPEATVFLDRNAQGSTPVIITNATAGIHLIEVMKDGYQTARKSVVIEDGKNQAVDINLELLTSLLLIHSTPAQAEITIDQASHGQTPALVSDMSLGKHRIELSKLGYIPKIIDITVKDQSPLLINETLISDSASLVIDSTPQGARVLINGADKGTTPCTVSDIQNGTTHLELSYDGYYKYENTLKLQAGQSESVKAVLKAIPSILKIVTIPSGARIYVENQFRGLSPLSMENMKPGTYRIRADLAAHSPMARSVVMRNADSQVEEFRFERNCGLIDLTTEPAGVTIFIDGVDKGKTVANAGSTDKLSEPLKIDFIEAGQHKIQLVKKGYYSYEFKAAIKKDDVIPLHKKLKRRFIPDYKIITETASHTGVLLDEDTDGNITLELRPGITKKFLKSEIKAQIPIRTTKPVTVPSQ